MTAPTRTDNALLKSKLELRRHALRRYHAAGDIRVFDCCQGGGVIWSRLKAEFPVTSYWGVDVKPKRGRLAVDSRRIVCQPDLRCNVIDIDTYGMPWDHWEGLLPNVVEPTTVFMTIGTATRGRGTGMKMPKTVLRSLGIPGDWPLSPAFTEYLVGLSLNHFLSLEPAGGHRVSEVWESTSGFRTRYLAVRIDKPTETPPAPPPATPAAKRRAK
jgi:hypothetical protein